MGEQLTLETISIFYIVHCEHRFEISITFYYGGTVDPWKHISLMLLLLSSSL